MRGHDWILKTAFCCTILLACKHAPDVDNPPDTPAVPSGVASGAMYNLYRFTANTNDQDGDSVSYRFDWGDGDTSDWTSFHASGETAFGEHRWLDSGAFEARAQAMDMAGAASDWSSELPITIARGPRWPDSIISTVEVGVAPIGVAALPDGEFVYVANNADGTVSVIRTQDNTVVATVAVGAGPWGIAASPTGELVYVANSEGNTISVIRTADNIVADSIVVWGSPTELAILPDGDYLYAIHSEYKVVSVIRTSDNTLLKTIPLSGWPSSLIATPSGEFVLVACYDEAPLSIIETSRQIVTNTVDVGDYASGIAITPDGARAYVSIAEDLATQLPGLCVVRLSDFAVVDTLIGLSSYACEPQAASCTPDGAYVIVLPSEPDWAYIDVVSTVTNQLVARVGDEAAYAYGPYGLAVLPDGRIYSANEGDDTVTVFGYSSVYRGAGRRLPR